MDDLPKNDQDQEKTTTKTEPIEIGSLDPQPSSPPNIDQTKEPKSELETQLEKNKESIPKTAPLIEENQKEVKPATVTDIKEEPIKAEIQQTAEKIEETPSAAPPKKGKSKIKNISAIIGLLVIIVALPISLFLVKQRQEIRKEAATPGLSGSVSLCGITVSPIGQNFNKGTYTFTYSITSNDGKQHNAEVHTYGCACNEGNRSSCGTNSGKCEGKSFTINTPHTGTITTPKIGDCGTYQADVFILSVDGNKGCYTNK